MKRKSFSYRLVPAIFVILSSAGIHAQTRSEPEPHRYVAVPPTFSFLLIANQPRSPIGFKDMTLLLRTDNHELVLAGRIYNAGAKPIRYVSLMWGGADGVGTLHGSGPMSGAVSTELLMPGEEIKDDDPPEIVPLTDELKQKLNLGDNPKALVVLMVRSVTFDDGTKYTDEKTTTSIQNYLEALGEKIEYFDYNMKKRPNR